MTETGRPMFPHLKHCVRCCMPETQEGVDFDDMGICRSCRSTEIKMHIDWAARERALARIMEQAKAEAGDGYDCIIPISGGKDSMFQMHVLTQVYGMKPLAVTHSHNWYSETGWYNLQLCLEAFGVDHIMFTPARKLVNRLARKSLVKIGDTCWHCHAGVGSFPLHIATKFRIPLLIWGESLAESSGRATYDDGPQAFDRETFTRISAKSRVPEMVGDGITMKDLVLYEPPSAEECEAAGIKGIYLGDYMFWDDERQTEFLRDEYGWRETTMEGTYKCYKSAECVMPGMHDFTCYLKRGYGRGTFHATMDVRNGLLTREEGFELARQTDSERPAIMDYYCEITGYTEAEVLDIMKGHRLAQLKDVEVPVRQKNRPHEEPLRPYMQRLLERYRDGKE
ncbi:N-acetyl sugar amidotransferase [Magnetospirillum sp. UT-4]|uniref:N-acetyl sugar amidotransferase n=1 Tax=Magnetospirillum sp. UT-4 TaxID=2681467 RepID=UPI0013816D6F|nr:N-acetyl sugar amidotransferase [Magnetospirillum sp. UT-4]CAA7618648.1 N-acetyl sugar amidotransferase [Magnetospirillum sp. UT-4]